MSKIRFVKRNCSVALRAFAVVVVLAPASALAGDRWCYTEHPDAVFCDDFDRYCTAPGLPGDPNHTCEPVPGDGCVKANDRALEVWVPIECGARINLDEHGDCSGNPDAFPVTAPFGAKYPKGDQGHHNVNLGAYANTKWGGLANSVKGTDANPLVLEFILNGQTDDKLHHANTFIELALVDGLNLIDHRAPTDYIYDDLCVSEPDEVNIQHPMICQQDVPPAGCPSIATAPHHSSIAIGALAYLDKTPCESPNYLPTNDHLAVFDGYKWWTLPASFPGSGNFLIGDGENHIALTLFETTMLVELTSQGSYSYCTMPREYKDLGGDDAIQGAFNKLSLGFGMSCLIDQGAWTCANEVAPSDRRYQCIPTVSYSQDHPVPVGPVYDNVALYGGEWGSPPPIYGACCLTNGQCADWLYEYDCETLQGGQWQGWGTMCTERLCCAEPYADADGDGDVDQVDFGLWATGDSDVDDLDFADFEACWSGPTVPADPTCDDDLHM